MHPEAVIMGLRIHAELLDMIREDALNTYRYPADIICEIVAAHYKRKDLARPPRKVRGRKPQKRAKK